MTTTTALYLYRVRRADGHVRYDENAGFVIAAPDGDAARRIAAANASDEGEGPWLDTARSIVRNIGVAHDDIAEGVILQDFNAG
jgi:hypothetical protein